MIVWDAILTRGSKIEEPSKAGANGELLATAPVIARWLGIFGKAVYDLAKAGILVRFNREQFLLEESVRRYCDHLRGASRRQEPDEDLEMLDERST